MLRYGQLQVDRIMKVLCKIQYYIVGVLLVRSFEELINSSNLRLSLLIGCLWNR